MSGRFFEVQAGREVTLIFTQIDTSGNLASGQASSITKILRDQEGAATETVTVEEQGSSGFYEARFTPTKSEATGYTYFLRLVSPPGATDGAILEWVIRTYPSLTAVSVGGAMFTTLANVKDYAVISGTSLDALITNMIARTTWTMQDYIGRRIIQATVTEFRDGKGLDRILVKEWPIIAVNALYQSLEQAWDSSGLIASSDYLVHKEAGRICLKGGRFLPGFQNVRVDYDGGYSSVPASIEGVCVRAVSRELKARQFSNDTVSQSFKDGSITFAQRQRLEGLSDQDRLDLAPWVRLEAA